MTKANYDSAMFLSGLTIGALAVFAYAMLAGL